MAPTLPTHVGLRCANPTYKTSLQIFARCTHRSAEQGPLWGCDRVGARKPAFSPSAKATGYRVRLRPISRRPVCGSSRIAPRFTNADRSLVRPFPHRRYAYRVRGASPQAGPLLHAAPNPCSAIRGRTSLRFAPRLRPQRQLFSFLSARSIIQHKCREQ